MYLLNLQLINCSSRNNSILSTEKPCLRPVSRQTVHIHIQNLLVLGGLTPENNSTNPHSLETSSLCIVLTSNKESAKLEIIS